MHEHVLVDFIGADQVSPRRYDADAVFTRALPHLRQVKALGWRDAGRVHAGISRARSACCCKRLAEASGLHILSNTGYYGANNDKHLPPHAFAESAGAAGCALDRARASTGSTAPASSRRS